ncbi:hypothetical protein [Thalassotalea maritima]|uniref:hypothetical protein n=1 Tax=Thalassotalea maritima TaxID=3242416 RepID=UPI0035290E81
MTGFLMPMFISVSLPWLIATLIPALTIALLFIFSFSVISHVDAQQQQLGISEQARQQRSDPLSALRWQKRLLIFNSEHINHIPKIDSAIVQEYRLDIIVINKAHAYRISDKHTLQPLSNDEQWHVTDMYPQAERVWLIGLDGTLKATYALSQFNLEEVTALINTMPMRRNELGQ